MADDKRVDSLVHVMLGGTGKIRAVSSTREAAKYLIRYRWPKGTGTKHRSARRACLDVLSGLMQSSAASKAFEAAAKESDILAEPGP